MRSPRNSWTPERVILGIKTLAAEGYELNSKAIMEAWPQLASAARRNFITVRAAVEAAGLEYIEVPRTPNVGTPGPRKWTCEAMLAELQTMAAGQPLSAGAVKRRNDGLYYALRQEWGTAQAAIEAAGIVVEYKKAPRCCAPKPVAKIANKPSSEAKTVTVVPVPVAQLGGITYPAFEQMFDQRRKDNGRELNRIVSPLSMGEAQRVSGR